MCIAIFKVNCHGLVHFYEFLDSCLPAIWLFTYLGSLMADLLCATKYEVKPDDDVMKIH